MYIYLMFVYLSLPLAVEISETNPTTPIPAADHKQQRKTANDPCRIEPDLKANHHVDRHNPTPEQNSKRPTKEAPVSKGASTR